MHKLLARQLRQCFGSADAVPEAIRPFVTAVDRSYQQSDHDRGLLEHSLETVSDELIDRFQRLRDALAESQRAEEGLGQALSALTATLESTTDGILVVDEHGKMLQMNRKFLELWQIPEDIQRSRDDNLALAFVLEQLRDPEEFLKKVRDLYSQPEAESFDMLTFKDGRVIERYSLPQRVGGETVGRVWSFRDVTERRHLEDQLRQSQKMEAVGQLAGGVAHDFNNLLTVVRAHADFLLESIELDQPERTDVGEIIMAASRAGMLTRQLLAFSRKQILQPVTLDLNGVVAGMEPMLRRLIGEDVEITTIQEQHLRTVTADAGQLEQVLVNLVVNARDAMPRGGRITIETANVDLDESSAQVRNAAMPSGAYVLLAVSDNGTGISPQDRTRIFEPFFTTKQLGHGTGLGLSTVFGIAKQSGGYVWVDSEVGVGSTFRVFLPRAVTAVESAPQVALIPAHLGGSETILLAEDEEAVRKLVRRILEGYGYTVLAASNGIEALKLASERTGEINLLLTDVIMPVLGGPELVERLRAERPGIHVLYMSGYTDRETDREGVPWDRTALVQKPFTRESLALAVRTALDDAAARGDAEQAGAGTLAARPMT